MRQRATVIVIAILLGLVAAAMVTQYANRAGRQVMERTKPIKVLVAKGELPLGATLAELRERGLVETKSVPKEFVAAGALRASADLGERVLTVSSSAGEQLTEGKFQVSRKAGLAFAVPEDMVAVGIPIDEMKAAGDLVKVGDYVNVIGTANISNDQDTHKTKTILFKVRVLAVGQRLENQPKADATPVSSLSANSVDRKSNKTVTLAMTQADAEKLIWMQEDGRIWLTVIRSKEAKTAPTEGQTIETVWK